jgi:ribA/ribD-fused uncharacterized protein
MNIYFYSPRGKYGFLANFSNHPIAIEGEIWQTVEHYYQAQKFPTEPSILSEVKAAQTPAQAKGTARKYHKHVRPDWSRIKETVMHRAVEAKFVQHPELVARLLATEGAKIVELARDDAYWGVGPDGHGLNRMGEIIMHLRGHFSRGRINRRAPRDYSSGMEAQL